MPAAELVARLGRRALAWQAMARGEDQRPLVPASEEERFEASLDLEWPIEGIEPLSFVLTRLLEPLSIRLERRDRGAAVLHVRLQLVTRAVAGDGREVHVRRLELPSPIRDVRALRTLALLDLESHPPDAAIRRVTLVIDPTPGRIVQHTLFARPEPTPDQLATLLARLRAVMGQDRVGAPREVDSYRPGAFGMRGFLTAREIPASRPVPAQLISTLRRYRHPLPARVALANGVPVRLTIDRRGAPSAAIVQAVGPWRASGEWWARQSAVASRQSSVGSCQSAGAVSEIVEPQMAYDRDEWDVALGDGTVYRLFQDCETAGWFVDAVID